MKKILLIIFFASLFLFLSRTTINAAGLSVEFEGAPLAGRPIFSTARNGYWMPCDSLTKAIIVRNTSGQSQIIALLPENEFHLPIFPDVSSIFEIKISDNYGNILYGGPLNKKYLYDFYQLTEEYPLSVLGNNSSVTYFFNASLECSLGNEWQNRQTGFDLRIGFSLIPTPTTTPSPTPTNTPIPGPTNTPQPGPTNTPGPGPTNTPGPEGTTSTTALGTGGGTYITYEYGAETIDVPVLGLKTSITPSAKPSKTSTPSEKAGKVKGSGICVDPWWWWVVFIIQILSQLLLRQIGGAQSRNQIFFWFILSELIFGFVFWKFFCTLLYLLISIVIFCIFAYLIYRKTKPSSEEKAE